MSVPVVRFHRGGVHLPDAGLWLDPSEPQSGPERVFVSHAHSDHTGIHREIIVSEPTSKLMHARLEGDWSEHVLRFGERRSFALAGGGEFGITLLPAGHIFGSAMALIETASGSVLYTGDFKLRPSRSAETCDPEPARGCDLLIMETTFGRPGYRFPPVDEVMKGMVRFCREALDNDETPVLLGYSLGKSQEILCALQDADLPIMLHGQIYKMTQIYEQFGQCFPPYTKYDSASARGRVQLCPPNVVNSTMLRNLGRARTAILTGWAVDASCRYRYGVDAAFPLSDHADFTDLVAMVERVQPKKVLTLHGFAADFAQSLRDMGWDAQALSEQDQLALPLAVPSSRPRSQFFVPASVESAPASVALAGEDRVAPERLFHRFAETCSAIGSTSKKLEKTRLLADYLRILEPEALAPVTVWFTGNAFPPSHNKVLQLGWAVIRDALCAVGELEVSAFGQVYLKHSDLGETGFEVLLKRAATEPTLSVLHVDAAFEKLVSARGPTAKLPLFVALLRQCSAIEGKYLIKIVTGDLRIGLKEGLVEEAIATAFELPLDQVKNAHLLVGDIGETARLAQQKALGSATLVPFRPVKFMLASPEETADQIWSRVLEWHKSPPTPRSPSSPPTRALTLAPALAPTPSPRSDPPAAPTIWIEDKYDGIRCQVHKVGDRVAVYSRDLKDITNTFLDVADAMRSMAADFVIDGEIVAMRGDTVLPFGELQRRLGRREGDLFLGEEIPVRLVAFDLLWLGGRTLLNEPLQHRRGLLETLSGAPLRLSQITVGYGAANVESAFTAARDRGNEGLMIKDPQSVYTPGRRGLAWLKLKKAYGTLDCVVVGAEYGHGKRKSVLSDYTFAVRDEATGELKTIGKAYSGLTDAEIAELTQRFLKTATRQQGRYFDVIPETVLEIGFDAVQVSDRHTSGLAMRFPRILRIRRDKSPADIDTLARAREMLKTR